jgi:mRNA-degrading endonuclease YafQ of YafQ-DinJ toxin-antitoxin module
MNESSRKWTLIRTDTFIRELRKYLKLHPDRAIVVQEALTLLEENPRSPSLRLHSLKGRMKGLHAVRLTYSDRITLILTINVRQVVLLNIGTHDDVYY